MGLRGSEATKMKPHKHAALIKEWSDGAEIEFSRSVDTRWLPCPVPFWHLDVLYRVKPTPHKHQDLIDAFMAGDKTIQFQGALGTGPWYYIHAAQNEFEDGFPHDLNMRRAHKWQKEMDAHAAGEKIQVRYVECPPSIWRDMQRVPHWIDTCEYRIKPKTNVRYALVSVNGNLELLNMVARDSTDQANLKLTFEDGKLISTEVVK